MSNVTPFGLSRIEAEGWNSARKYLPAGDPGDLQKIAALNPYRAPLERARWYAGFNNAMKADGKKSEKGGTVKNGWSVAVSGRSSGGIPKTRHYVVAMEDEAQALRAVEAIIAASEVAAISSAVDANLLELRNMAPGEVRMLGGNTRKKPQIT